MSNLRDFSWSGDLEVSVRGTDEGGSSEESDRNECGVHGFVWVVRGGISRQEKGAI